MLLASISLKISLHGSNVQPGHSSNVGSWGHGWKSTHCLLVPWTSIFIFFFFFFDWQVISTGLLRGRKCCTDTPRTSTDPSASLKLWRTSMLLFLTKKLGKPTSLLLKSTGGKDGVQNMSAHHLLLPRENILDWTISKWVSYCLGRLPSLWMAITSLAAMSVVGDVMQHLHWECREHVGLNLEKDG